LRCPRCGSDIPNKPAKEWDFRKGYYHVKKYPCPNCKKSVFEYYHEGKLGFTIPKTAKTK
jgi:ribosomal protein S27AE